MKQLTQSILIVGPSGAGKSFFARSALEHEGSGLVLAAPGVDELDSYYGLNEPEYVMQGFDDSTYFPTLEQKGAVGLRDAVVWLQNRLAEVVSDVKEGKAARYAVVVADTISAIGQLSTNATLVKFNRTEAPPAMSPDGAAFYTYLRSRQEEFMRILRAFKGYGVHVIALSHVGESEVGETGVAKDTPGKQKLYTALVPGAFKLALPSYFSTVMYADVGRGEGGKRVHYLQWQPDAKKPMKNRFGDLNISGKVENNWPIVKRLIEEAAAKKLV